MSFALLTFFMNAFVVILMIDMNRETQWMTAWRQLIMLVKLLPMLNYQSLMQR